MIYSLFYRLYKGIKIFTMFDSGATWYQVDEKCFDTIQQAEKYINEVIINA